MGPKMSSNDREGMSMISEAVISGCLSLLIIFQQRIKMHNLFEIINKGHISNESMTQFAGENLKKITYG